jgi:hypothetical protein
MPAYDVERITQELSQKPRELEQLNQLVGKWHTSGTVEFIGLAEPIQTTGTSEAAWECDGRMLVERSRFDMGPLGAMSGMSLWNWDPHDRCYRMWWFDSFGERTSGKARYDERKRTWSISTRGRGSLCRVVTRGTIRVVDDHELEWTWDQWDSWGILRFARMRGTSLRQ